MRDGGRLSAAIEVLSEVESRHRPVQLALRDWGTSHRFAGSGDRTVIGNLVYDALRYRQSLAWRMGSEEPRVLVLATYVLTWEQGLERLKTVLAEDHHAPEPLSETEEQRLAEAPEGTPEAHDAADVPAWLWPSFLEVFGENAEAEGRALATRAPIDMRLNTLKSTREKLLKRLAHAGAEATAIAPTGLRIAAKAGSARMPHVQAEEGYQKGWFELQDEASQIVSLLAGAKAGEQVLDLCAGGGGKTLALAAAMENKGQIYAFDADRLRLAPIHERLKRAGVHNVQVRDPASSKLDDLKDGMDLVFIDAPCTGTGVWRRRPDSKWKLTEKALADRVEDQARVLDTAAGFVKPGGRLAYVTCSVLPQENSGQIKAFLERHPEFSVRPALASWQGLFGTDKDPAYAGELGDLLLTPATTGSDGFYFALLERSA
ncbi:RsmB/NOP family class I SAM-dependent RNA methyltransferase [Roseibium suaedae]|uniref:16S rRNA (Cytosine967-C5)-methyltransferase n=1 Tax=Roseibium suaedae TaxID=735517 RepID=A0A1M7KIA4_9HYPH|nr:RsmB/NOP family class I SAM-dependent RNA methyltransferase [Roseibium suaedae]SHM65130.1 16S rRNA (cytosine967-C5)-methyltransferase [Roseibium suaedae]